MFCHHCGASIEPQARFCPACGQTVGAAVPPASPAETPVWTPPAQASAQTGKWIGDGWAIVKADLGNSLLITLLFMVLSGIPFIGGALLAGYQFYYLRKLSGRGGEVGDLFKGFNFFLPTLLASLVTAIFVFAGTLLCIIPGLVVAAMYKFTYLFIIDKRLDFWPAMQASHAIVKQDYVGFTLFLLACFFVNVLGALCCIVGLFVTIPLTMAAIASAYRDLVGFDPRSADVY
jgi:hypothetical protein